MIFLVQVLILAIVQGITEFLPISSSGHLVIFQHLFHFNQTPMLYDICFHVGTLAAVFAYFFSDLKDLGRNFNKPEQRKFLFYIIIATVPTALLGLIFKDSIETLFQNISYISYAYVGAGLFILLSRYIRIKKPNMILLAFIIGIFQGIALIPGVSRSGMTIAVALMLGSQYEFAFKFSFILSIPAILGAVILKSNELPSLAGQAIPLVLGMTVAFATGLVALGILKRIIKNNHFHLFGYYCLAAAVVIFLFIGR